MYLKGSNYNIFSSATDETNIYSSAKIKKYNLKFKTRILDYE